MKKNPVVRLTGWEVTEDNKLHITDFDVLENLLEFPVLGSPRQLPLIDLKPSIKLKVQAEAKEKATHVESEKKLAQKQLAEKLAEKQLAENITKQKWEKKILHEAFILKQARSRVERRKVKIFLTYILLVNCLFLNNFEISCNSFQVPRIAEPEKPPIPFYLDHLNLDKNLDHLKLDKSKNDLAKEEQLLRSDELFLVQKSHISFDLQVGQFDCEGYEALVEGGGVRSVFFNF